MNILIEEAVFEIELMSSGRSCLNLSSRVDWEGFSDYAERLACFLGAEIQKKTDSFDFRVWELLMHNEIVRLVFDDFPVMVSLESTSEVGDSILLDVKCCLDSEAR